MKAGAPAVAERGENAVRALRDAEGPIARWLRVDGPELLDLDSTPATVKQRILDDVERLARLLLVDRYWMRRIARLIREARRLRAGKPVRVLDVGAGGGWLLARIEDWARAQRISVELMGVDNSPEGIAAARRRFAEEGRRITMQVGDARDLAHVGDGAVDVALTTFVLHHLPPGDAARVLGEMDRVSAVNFFAFDLRRTIVALPPLMAFLRLTGFEAPTRHDATVSLRRGYTAKEMRALVEATGIAGVRVETPLPSWMVVTRA